MQIFEFIDDQREAQKSWHLLKFHNFILQENFQIRPVRSYDSQHKEVKCQIFLNYKNLLTLITHFKEMVALDYLSGG